MFFPRKSDGRRVYGDSSLPLLENFAVNSSSNRKSSQKSFHPHLAHVIHHGVPGVDLAQPAHVAGLEEHPLRRGRLPCIDMRDDANVSN